MWNRSDSLALFLTGATSDGGAQTDELQSLGNYRSSTRAGCAPFLPPDLHYVQVIYVAQANGVGAGSLTAVDANSLSWCAPGDIGPGPAVSIANGQTVLLESSGSPDSFILVSRFSATDLVGDATLQILQEQFNDVIAQNDFDFSLPTYRAVMLKNGPTQTVRNLKIWLGQCDNPVTIGLEYPATQPNGPIQAVINRLHAPTGVTFAAPISSTEAAVLTVSQLLPNQAVGLWICRDLSAATAAPIAETQIFWSYVAVG